MKPRTAWLAERLLDVSCYGQQKTKIKVSEMYLYIVRSILGVGVTRHEIFERRFHVRLKANNSAEVSAHMSYTTNDRLLLLLLLSEQMNSSAESLRVARDTNRHQCAERHAIIHLASARLVT